MRKRISELKDTATEYATIWKTNIQQTQQTVTKFAVTLSRDLRILPTRSVEYMTSSCKYFISNPSVVRNEILSGASIAFMQVPESVAFAFVAGISPVKGLYSTFFIGLIAGIMTSLPGMVSGIAGGMVGIQKELTSDQGPLGHLCLAERTEWLFATTLFCGVLQVVLGLLGVTRFLRLVPHSVMIGFMNGLAIIIFRAQLHAFQVDDSSKGNGDGPEIVNGQVCPPIDYRPPRDQRWLGLDEWQTWQVLLIVFLAMAIMWFQPRIKQRLRIGKWFSIGANIIPASLTAMILCTIITQFIYGNALHSPVRTIGDMATFPPGNIPKGHIPQVPWREGEFWRITMQRAILLAVVGLVETAMTWQLCQKIIQTNLPASRCNYDCVGQGMGNLMSSFFTSVGGSVMVGQTTVNFLNGSRTRIASTVASFLILLFVSVAGKVIEMIPVAALTGILFVIVVKTFEWRTFVYLLKCKIPVSDMVTIVLVTVLAVVTDLAIAVLIGVAWASVVIAWKVGGRVSLEMSVSDLVKDESSTGIDIQMEKTQVVDDNNSNSTVVVVNIRGAVFFGSATTIATFFSDPDNRQILSESSQVMLDLSQAVVYDFSGVEALKDIIKDNTSLTNVHIRGLDMDPTSLDLVTKSKRLQSHT